MRGTSLIPAESASFPDLVGHDHGFRHPKARRSSLRRAQRKAALTKAQGRLECVAQNPVTTPAEEELQPLSFNQPEEEPSIREVSPDLEVTPAEEEFQPLASNEAEEQSSIREVSPALDVTPPEEELQPLASNEAEELPSPGEISPALTAAPAEEDLQPVSVADLDEQGSTSQAAELDVEAEEDLHPLNFEESTEQVSVSSPSPAPSINAASGFARELLLPLIFDEATEGGGVSESLIAPLTPLSVAPTPQIRSSITASGDEVGNNFRQPSRQIPAPKTAPGRSTPPVRVALPIPPRRSMAQSRAKIQSPETVPGSAANRPRTPVRGLTIVRPRPVLPEKSANGFFSRISLSKLPRCRLIKLLRFIACETIVVAILVLTMGFGLPHTAGDDSLALLLKVLAGIAAVAIVGLPVIFYGLPAALSAGDR
jgi:hypothetical protein